MAIEDEIEIIYDMVADVVTFLRQKLEICLWFSLSEADNH